MLPDIEPRQPNTLLAVPALLALAIVGALALFPDPKLLSAAEMGPDKLTLLFLAVCFLVALVPAFARRFIENRDAATWAITVASVILFHIADRAGVGLRIPWKLTPGEPLTISYAMCAVVLGALLSAGAWVRGGAPERAMIVGLVLLGALGFGSFELLSRFYKVGVVEILDPTPMGTLMTQVLGYVCLALCARAATATPALRNVLFKIMPLLLLAIWARHQFAPIPAPVEAE